MTEGEWCEKQYERRHREGGKWETCWKDYMRDGVWFMLEARRRTAERLWAMRAQLREADAMLEAYNYTTGYYLADVRERREAVQRVRAEPLQSQEPQGPPSQT